jgi:hypothetical protein
MKILMTDGSSTSARQSITCLGQQHSIDILDPSRLCQCRFSTFVNRWYRCPPFSRQPQDYLRFLVDRIETGTYDVLFPTHEQIYLVARFPQLFASRVAMAVPPFDVLDGTMNKVRTAKLLDEAGLPQPAYRIVQSKEELLACDQFPCWIKLDFSTAGQGVRHAVSRLDLERVASEMDELAWFDGTRQTVVQEHASGFKRAACGIFQHGELVAFHVTQSRRIGIGGSANAKQTVHDSEMKIMMTKFGSHLNWHGAMSLEYVYDEASNRRWIFECNPRIGETVLALESGVNLCQALIDVALGKGQPNESMGELGTRTHLGFLTLTSMAIDGATRRQLLGELFRLLRSEGDYENSRDEITRWSSDWLSIFPFLGVTGLLLINPKAAGWLVRKTVENYSLTPDGAKTIRTMDFVK